MSKAISVNPIQIILFVQNHVMMKYKLKMAAVALLNYYADAPSWKNDRIILAGDMYVRSEYEYDIIQKNPGLRRELSKRSFVKVMKELDDAGVIAKLYRGNKLYIHVFPSVIHDLKNAKILIDDDRIKEYGIQELKQDELSSEAKKERRKSSARAIRNFYEEIMAVYPMKVFSSGDETKIKQMKLVDRREEFLKAIDYLNTTEKVTNGYAPKLSNFFKEWESYINGVPEGVRVSHGVEVKKITNGAAAPVDPFESFIVKSVKISDGLFQNGKMKDADELEKQWNAGEGREQFAEHEANVISAIGFKRFMTEIMSGDFVHNEVKPTWDESK